MNDSYHMIGYIHETPAVLSRTLEGNEDSIQALVTVAARQSIRRIILAGVGSSYTAALMALPLFRKVCDLPTFVFSPGEIEPLMSKFVDRHTLFVSISRSGERGGVVEVLKQAVSLGAFGLAVTGSADSLLAQNAPHLLVTREGSEITFAKTKSVATCTGLLMRLALALASPEDPSTAKRLEDLRKSPALMGETISEVEPVIKEHVSRVHRHQGVLSGGTVGNHGAALEFAIKLQETANIPVVGSDTDNLLHGAWGPVGPEWLVVLLVTRQDQRLSQRVLELAGHMGGHRLVIGEPGLHVADLAEYTLTLPHPVDGYTSGLIFLGPLQLLTYYWCVASGFNPDAPARMEAMLNAMVPPGRKEPEMRG